MIAFAAAIALAFLAPVDPLAQWPLPRVRMLFFIALGATVASIVAIVVNDWPLKTYKSAALEWAHSPDQAAHVLSVYEQARQRPVAMRGLLLDSFAFIPSYVVLLATAAFWLAKLRPEQPWHGLLIVTGWAAFAGGLLDYAENYGIYVALEHSVTTRAPLTFAFCQLKWFVILTAAAFVAIVRVLK